MKMKKHTFTRMIAGLLSAVIILANLPTEVFSAENKIEITFDSAYMSDGTPIRFQRTFTSPNGIVDGSDTGKDRKKIIYGNGVEAYCIEPGVPLNTGDVLEAYASVTWDGLRDDQKNMIKLALAYGKPGNAANLSGSGGSQYIATQILVWEIVNDWRDMSTYERTNDAAYLSICSNDKNEEVGIVYDEIVEGMKSHGILPSFVNYSYEMEFVDGKYSLALTDTNNVLAEYEISCTNENIVCSVENNTLTLTFEVPVKDELEIIFHRKPMISHDGIILDYGSPGVQSLIIGVEEPDTVSGSIAITAVPGSLKLIKESEDGKVEGVTMTISGSDYTKTVTTGTDGTILIEGLVPGSYQVTEHVEESYEPQEVQTIEVLAGQENVVTFSNKLKRGHLIVQKNAEDGLPQGAKFHLYGTSASGNPVDEYAAANEEGKAVFEDVLISGPEGYTLEEVDTEKRYVVPDSQNVTILWGEVTTSNVENRLKKFSVSGKKKDSEAGVAQGEGTLEGAVYGLYHNGQLVEQMTTDGDGGFSSAYYPCGEGWTVQEIQPSKGYLLDDTVYSVPAESKNYVVEYNKISDFDLNEQVIKGQIAIVKHMDDGDTQIETPESGAVFEVYLTAAGSFGASKESERDLLTTDATGFAISKELPYGLYTVCQRAGAPDRDFVSSFTVQISQHGQIYPYIINNAVYTSYLRVIKTDAETGLVIPLSGAGFQIYDSTGEKVIMKDTYPVLGEIDTFYVNEEGYLITPETLEPGEYTLVEVQAPYGYVLDSTPLPFLIERSQGEMVDGREIVTVTARDTAQKGRITVSKEGEIFHSVNITSDRYEPVYRESSLAGVVFQIVAGEDILTGDGTIRYKKGELADQITTDEKGNATSKELYLGKYEIIEVKGLEGFFLSEEPVVTELCYGGQEVSVTETQVTVINERKKVKVQVSKELEQDEVFGIGKQDEVLKVTFGLYAGEELVAADGKKIPKDGLIEVAGCNDKGEIIFDADLPAGKYYILEENTEEHYVLSQEKYEFVVDYSDQDSKEHTIQINNGNSIRNTIKRGKITGWKVNEKEEGLSGAVFGLFYKKEDGMGEAEDKPKGQNPDFKAYTQEDALLIAESKEDGSFLFENVPYGEYVVVELKAPEGYEAEQTEYALSVLENGQSVEIKVCNKAVEEDAAPSPETGDKNQPGYWILMLVPSMFFVVLCISLKRKTTI